MTTQLHPVRELLALTTWIPVFSDPEHVRTLLIHMCGEDWLREMGERSARSACARYLQETFPELDPTLNSDLLKLARALEIIARFAPESAVEKMISLILILPGLRETYEVPQLPDGGKE